MLVGITSCIVILSFVAYSKVYEDKKKSEKDPPAIDSSGPDKQHPVDNGDEEGDNMSKPMFEYNNRNLFRTIINMADQRATRWMSFQVSGAQSMIGQVGGKSIRVQKRPILILDTFVMKPVNQDHRGVREIAFYEAIQAATKRSGFKTYCSLFGPRVLKPPSIDGTVAREETDDTQPCCDEAKSEIETKLLHRLELFTARYFGTVEYDEKKLSLEEQSGPFGIKSNSYLLLHNITTHFSKPCVLDIKMGTKTFEPDAPEEKKFREQNKYSSQIDFGFRMIAMRIYDPSNAQAGGDGYVYFPKQFGRSLGTRESVKEALLIFLGGGDLPKHIRAKRSTAIQRILSRLKMIKGWFKDNKVFAFYGSSILIIYEGDTVPNEADGVELDMARAKMIDFGRIRRQPGGDLGYLKGLRTLIILLEEILKESFLETSKYIRTQRF